MKAALKGLRRAHTRAHRKRCNLMHTACKENSLAGGIWVVVMSAIEANIESSHSHGVQRARV